MGTEIVILKEHIERLNMAQKIVFIAGLPRSGSTVLELILGNLPLIVGLGEVFGFMKNLDRANDIMCSCENTARTCDFWGPTLMQLLNVKRKNQAEMYRILLKSFEEHFGKESVPVDSSKRIEVLKILQEVADLDIKVIYLIRDIRAWVTSFKKFSAGKQKLTSIRYFLRWYRGNLQFQRYLKQTNTNYFQIGYEELILYPDISIRRIADFLKMKCTDSIINLRNFNGHNIGGNRMLQDPKKRENLYYDNRWFYNHFYWLLPMILFPNIMRFNFSFTVEEQI